MSGLTIQTVKGRRQHKRVARARRSKRAPTRTEQARAVTKLRVTWKNLWVPPRRAYETRKAKGPAPVRAAERIVQRAFIAIRKAARWN